MRVANYLVPLETDISTALAYSLEEAASVIDEIGLPCVVKPLDNCASRGIQRVADETELEGAYDLAVGAARTTTVGASMDVKAGAVVLLDAASGELLKEKQEN